MTAYSRSLVLLACLLLAGCGENQTATVSSTAAVEDTSATVGSFRLRNGEMRNMLVEEAEERGVEVWFNEDGSIGYHVADGKEVDAIMNWVFAVFWVNN